MHIRFKQEYEKYNNIIHEDSMVFVIGKISCKGDNDENKILCDDLIPLTEVWDRCVKNISFSLKANSKTEQQIKEIKNILSKNRGRIPIYINVKTPENGEYVFRSKKITARPCPELVNKLSTITGVENIWIESWSSGLIGQSGNRVIG